MKNHSYGGQRQRFMTEDEGDDFSKMGAAPQSKEFVMMREIEAWESGEEVKGEIVEEVSEGSETGESP